MIVNRIEFFLTLSYKTNYTYAISLDIGGVPISSVFLEQLTEKLNEKHREIFFYLIILNFMLDYV